MAKKEAPPEANPGAGLLVMFVSLNLILLIFFIFLNSIGADDETKKKQALGSLVGTFGMLPSGLQITEGQKLLLPGPSFITPQEQKVDFAKEFRKLISGGDSVPEEVSVSNEGTNVVINLADKVLFTSGKADIIPSAENLLDGIADIIKSRNKEIWIEGYTDDLPISTAQYPSNWELSAARAMAVLRYFHENKGVRLEGMTAVGFAEFRPLMPNDRPQNRAANRRVRIVLIGST